MHPVAFAYRSIICAKPDGDLRTPSLGRVRWRGVQSIGVSVYHTIPSHPTPGADWKAGTHAEHTLALHGIPDLTPLKLAFFW